MMPFDVPRYPDLQTAHYYVFSSLPEIPCGALGVRNRWCLLLFSLSKDSQKCAVEHWVFEIDAVCWIFLHGIPEIPCGALGVRDRDFFLHENSGNTPWSVECSKTMVFTAFHLQEISDKRCGALGVRDRFCWVFYLPRNPKITLWSVG